MNKHTRAIGTIAGLALSVSIFSGTVLADENELGMTILENTIRMIQQMKRKILVEGVETKEQKEMLEKLKVDYMQGYYFSKPIPKKDFLKLISIDKATKLM